MHADQNQQNPSLSPQDKVVIVADDDGNSVLYQNGKEIKRWNYDDAPDAAELLALAGIAVDKQRASDDELIFEEFPESLDEFRTEEF